VPDVEVGTYFIVDSFFAYIQTLGESIDKLCTEHEVLLGDPVLIAVILSHNTMQWFRQ